MRAAIRAPAKGDVCVIPSRDEPGRLWVVAAIEDGKVILHTMPGNGQILMTEAPIDDIEPPRPNRARKKE